MFDAEAEVKKLQEDFKELTVDLHSIQRQVSSRRGPEGSRGPAGPVGSKGDKGDTGTVSKEQAIAMFREVVNELLQDEVGKKIVSDVAKEIRRHLKIAIVKA